MLNKFALATLSAVALMASLPATASDDLRGDRFITVMDGNTLSGKMADGTPYKLYFVPGGQATIQQGSGTPRFGTWTLDRNGDVCLDWPNGGAENGCFRVSIDGADVTWSNSDGTHRGGLLGGVAPLEMSRAK